MAKYNNKHKVPNEKANEIRSLNNKDLVDRVSMEYQNWEAVKRQKKGDEEITRTKDLIKVFTEDMKADPEYQKAEEEFKTKKEELITEDHARLKEELKNLNEPYNEDIKSFEGLFKISMEELEDRKSSGVLSIWDLLVFQKVYVQVLQSRAVFV